MPRSDRNNCRGLKLTDHWLEVIERVVEQMICDTVDKSEMQ